MRRLLVCACACMLIAACVEGKPNAPTVQLVSPIGHSITVRVQIADQPAQWEQGLMHRTDLDPDSGMLFVFPTEQQLNFWMKNTLIPLDVLYFDAGGHFISSQAMEPCRADPCALYPSEAPARFALEMGAGFVFSRGVERGRRLDR